MNINRRRVLQGAAWSLPVISVGAIAPAFAASACEIWAAYTPVIEDVEFAGVAGTSQSSVSWWLRVEQTPRPANACTDAPEPSEPFTLTVDVLREAGDATRMRTMALKQPDFQMTNTIGPRGKSYFPLGGIDYQWVHTYDLATIYRLPEHRIQFVVHTGDSAGTGGRIYNTLRLNGNIQTFGHQGAIRF